VKLKRGSSSHPPIEPVIISSLRPGPWLRTGGGKTNVSDAQRARSRTWRRLARRFLVTGLLVALGLRLGAIAVQPIAAVYHSHRDIQVLEKEYASVRQRYEWLQSRVRHLNTSAGIEEEARRLGWVRSGEVPLRIVTLSEPSAPAGSPPPAAGGPAPVRAAGSAATGVSNATAAGTARAVRLTAQPAPTPVRLAADRPPRSATAERIQQFLATWGPTRWIGELLQ
jgi:cell division protein FtsB